MKNSFVKSVCCFVALVTIAACGSKNRPAEAARELEQFKDKSLNELSGDEKAKVEKTLLSVFQEIATSYCHIGALALGAGSKCTETENECTKNVKNVTQEQVNQVVKKDVKLEEYVKCAELIGEASAPDLSCSDITEEKMKAHVMKMKEKHGGEEKLQQKGNDCRAKFNLKQEAPAPKTTP